MGVVKEDTQRVGVTEKNARDRVRYIEIIYCVTAKGSSRSRKPFTEIIDRFRVIFLQIS